ncbi:MULTISPECIES: cation:proton antiporter [Paenibacillus]|jgi:monovalent cation:proton antiporter-2 (CPA2) family protein|uniref:Sodium:proton antiporter n=1 Tax=Paenibacillus glucanolyticus TaxID=59843 RepID=A0A168EVU1_9BACL|nr:MULTISPECIES: monovalent cation:proton antiporter-2 (CPA2) family protein [Paenibacillus]MCA4754204.1 cation:proton antiporter [Mycolicibacterium fortuitum]ETT31331.1 transporter, monovalent cation:proton antiporter-2 (CPA2) family protein [Paenibacillus sp. FSL R5-808]KZS44879.1 sodium:proton antiporter [Paenibacillus glucanolyticus]MDH6671074.1 monovalent cation:proton antiporter-2 (CPA2) family protein [Paenibacillus sp. LBL]OMF70183.1 sodium:proton antiporter [Paenibacillus glucanolytic
MEFVWYLVLILLFTKLAGDLSVRLGQPAVLGKLIVGILLGPAVLGWIDSNEFIHYVSEIGVLLLMFIAGLETDVEQLKKNWKSAVAVAVGGIILPFIGGYGVAELFGFSVNYALFMGVLFSATSVSISVQVLKDLDRLGSKEGTTILGAAVVDDILVVILLAFMMSFLGTGQEISMGLLIGKKVLFFVGVIIAGWLIVPHVLKWLSSLKVTEPVISIALVVCFGFSYFADLMGMAGIIGAFAAGIAISQTALKHTVEQKIEPIAYSIFVPVFFVSIGLNVSFQGVSQQVGFIVVLTIAAVLTKLLGGALGARITGFNNLSSFAVGAGMVSRGEVALIIASTGLQAGLLLPEYFTSVVIVVILTTLIAPPLLKILFQPQSKLNSSKEIGL